jgi:hypothetical protein
MIVFENRLSDNRIEFVAWLLICGADGLLQVSMYSPGIFRGKLRLAAFLENWTG